MSSPIKKGQSPTAEGDDHEPQPGASMVRLSSSSKPSIWSASKEDNEELVQKFLEEGVDVDVKNPDFYNETPLHYAVVHNRFKTAMLLLENGANVNASSSLDQRTPLHYAARNGNLELCEALLVRGADPLQPDKHGLSALVLAHSAGHMEVSTLLGKAHKQKNEEDPNSWKNALKVFLVVVGISVGVQVLAGYDTIRLWQ